MTRSDKDDRPDTGAQAPRRGLFRGLSGKVLALIILFIMLGEVLIYVPSIANFRVSWLKQRIEAAQIASLVLEATPDNMVSRELEIELLKNANAHRVALQRNEARHLMLRGGSEDLMIDQHFDLRARGLMMTLFDAFEALAAGDGRIIRVTDIAAHQAGDFTDIVIDEAPLRAAMIRYSVNILGLSMFLSVLVAALVYLTLHRLLVRPMRRITWNMVEFSRNPEDAGYIIAPSKRDDEIGTAEQQLAHMQSELAGMLQQKNHLAALGLAVSKISHDLRNMLASAQLITDRLGSVQDPTVQKFAPKLIASIDRAIDFCAHTLKYGRAQEAPPRRENFELSTLIEEVFDTSAARAAGSILWRSNVPDGFMVDADREHMFRILTNLCRNAVQVLEGAAATREGPAIIQIKAWREGAVVTIEVRDNCPGVPARAREHLFQAFQGSVRPGGTGLGLAIASELARAHGGEIRLMETDVGASFWIVVPDRVADITRRRADPGA
ncbi:MAG: sensor histidine kinase [Hyphomicrobiales bacterium]